MAEYVLSSRVTTVYYTYVLSTSKSWETAAPGSIPAECEARHKSNQNNMQQMKYFLKKAISKPSVTHNRSSGSQIFINH